MRSYRAVAVSIAALTIATVTLMTAPAALADTAAQTLSVLGNGSAFVAPDVAEVSISVSRSASTSRQALGVANGATRALVQAIRRLGVAAGDIQTAEVSVASALTRAGPRKRRLRVWTANETLSVRVRMIKLLGAVIDRATAAGASSLDGPSFSFSDPSAGKIQATRAALADARRRADDAAATLGYRVTGVQSVELDPQSQVPLPATGGSTQAASAPAATAVSPGTQEVDVEVAVVYTIAAA
jgi:uncharacterized protein YggE